jgi:hypothetical protein
VIVRKALCCAKIREGGSGEVHADLLSYAELVCGSVHVRRLTKDNKEEEELVDVAPHWGEPHISYVVIALCSMVVMLLM